jgi:hypothetical protein
MKSAAESGKNVVYGFYPNVKYNHKHKFKDMIATVSHNHNKRKSRQLNATAVNTKLHEYKGRCRSFPETVAAVSEKLSSSRPIKSRRSENKNANADHGLPSVVATALQP